MKATLLCLLLFTTSILSGQQEKSEAGLHIEADRDKMNKYENLMVDEINLVRTQPNEYIPHVEAYAEKMKDQPAQVKEAKALITFLKTAKALPSLKPMNCLYLSARDHAAEAGPSGQLTHKSADGRASWNRIYSSCKEQGMLDPSKTESFAQKASNENIGSYSMGSSQGYAENDPRTVNIMLLCGSFGRDNIFNPDWKYVGAFSYSEKKESFMKEYDVTMYQVDYKWIQAFAAGK